MDLSVLASNVNAAHTSLPIFTCNDHILELVLNRNFEEEWQCFLDSQAFYLVLSGSLNFNHGSGSTVEVKQGEYILVDQGNPFMLSDKESCNYLAIHKKSYNRESHPAKKTHSGFSIGNFEKDLQEKSITLNNHVLNLLTSDTHNAEETFMDSDRALFVLNGELVIADVYGEAVLENQEIANIPSHGFHRLYMTDNTTAFSFQRKDSKMVYLGAE